jgi:hypothetical protein
LNRFRKMNRANLLIAGQVGDSPRYLEHSVVGARGEVELGDRCSEKRLARSVYRAVLADLGDAHIGVCRQAGVGEALALARPGVFYARPHGRR